MQFVVIVIDTESLEFALTLAAIPVTIIILLAAAFFTRRENLVGTIPVIVSRTILRCSSIGQTANDRSLLAPLLRWPRIFPLQTCAYVL